MRIASHVVRRKVVCPDRQRGELENRAAHAAHIFRIVEQKQRDGGVAHVHRADAAVGIVLLGEEDHVAALVGDQLVRAYGVAVGRGGDQPVVLAAQLERLLLERFVQRAALGHERFPLRVQGGDRVQYGLAAARIVGGGQAAEIVDRGHVVIGGVDAHFKRRFFIDGAALFGGQAGFAGMHVVLARQIGVAPVDGDVVSAVAGKALMQAAHIGDVQRGRAVGIAHHGRLFGAGVGGIEALVELLLLFGVGRNVALRVAQPLVHEEAQRHIVRLSVRAFGGHVHIGHGHGQHVRPVEQQRGGEGDVYAHAGCDERGAGAGGRDLEGLGLHGLVRVHAEEAVRLSIDHGQAEQRLFLARPVCGHGVGQAVGRAPDGEIGVVDDQGQRRKAVKSCGHKNSSSLNRESARNQAHDVLLLS